MCSLIVFGSAIAIYVPLLGTSDILCSKFVIYCACVHSCYRSLQLSV